jgi:hypothetical protein
MANDERSVCEVGLELAREDRDDSYGHPYENFKRTAALWGAYLGICIDPRDVPILYSLGKFSREKNGHDFDNPADVCGYMDGLQRTHDEMMRRENEADRRHS